MEKIGAESLKDITIFEKPKYAIRFKKGDKDIEIDELLGIGSSNEYTGLAGLSDTNRLYPNNTERLFRFLYLCYGVISPYGYEDFVLLNELPSATTIRDIKNHINNGGCPTFFFIDNHMRSISKTNIIED